MMKLNHNPKIQAQPGSRAVVIGSGIAGLSAARVLANHFEEVSVIDRDWLPDEPTFRSGIPQAHHAHTLLPYGQRVLEKLFPGLIEDLLGDGAQSIDDDSETAYFNSGTWQKPEPKAAQPSVACSRPMLERELYQRIAEYPQVKILQAYEATGLMVDETSSKVTGIRVRSRQQPGAKLQELPADLVVDASGRNSKVPQWLASLGYTPPEEWRINAHAGYASRIYRQPEGIERDWKKLYISPNPPDGLRGGIILPLEGNRWHVTLIGIAGDYPPTDEEGFMEFARSLITPELYEAIRAAEPLTKIIGFRKSENCVRRYENLPRYLEGLLVLGDAVFTMNPVYALGMTAAAVSSQVLDQIITSLRAKTNGLEGLSAVFQKKLAASVVVLWRQAVNSDWRWPATEITDNTEDLYVQAV